MRHIRLFFGFCVPVMVLGTYAAACGDDDETTPPVTATDAALDVTTTPDGTTPDASTGDTSTGNDSSTPDATTNDATPDTGPDAGSCPPWSLWDGGPFLVPSPYLQASDSPFYGCPFTSYYHLATFEGADAGLPPGTDAAAGSIYPASGTSSIVDSVDGDDGFPDGGAPDAAPGGHPCVPCHSWFGSPMDFSFDEASLGALPTHAGMVWTDDGNNATVTFTAYGADGGLIGSQAVPGIGVSGVSGETGEDRFFGLSWDAGIRRITMSHTGGGIEIDHLQIGR